MYGFYFKACDLSPDGAKLGLQDFGERCRTEVRVVWDL